MSKKIFDMGANISEFKTGLSVAEGIKITTKEKGIIEPEEIKIVKNENMPSDEIWVYQDDKKIGVIKMVDEGFATISGPIELKPLEEISVGYSIEGEKDGQQSS